MTMFLNPDFDGTFQEADADAPITFADAEGNTTIAAKVNMPNEWVRVDGVLQNFRASKT